MKFGSENKDNAVKDYLTIADATWRNLVKNVSDFVINHGGTATVMKPEILRTKFADFNS
ncbi:hypothetical protein [Chryseobacterium sp.]|uniref:hypothetical protein n=1 Tax=Chryseobacterium sp. TaxID=1871047 RepID=UPI00388EE528